MTIVARYHLPLLLRATVATLAVVALVVVIRHVGVATFAHATKQLLPWVPLLFGLEGVRIASDAIALRAMCGDSARAISLRSWARLHLAANAALVVLPGGRAVSEGMKIARLQPVLGGGRAAAIVATLHVTTLLGIAIISYAAALMAVRAPSLCLALAAHGTVCLVGALSLRAALYRAQAPAMVKRWLGGDVIDDLRTESRALPFVPATAMGAKLVNRGAQAVQFAIVLGSATGGVLASGVSLLGGVVSDLSIASIGATDGAFVLAAPALSLAVPAALVVAGIARLVSLGWSALGAVV